MTLSAWNTIIAYGNKLCNELNDDGYNVVLKSYTMYDGRKGLKMQVLDAFGEVYKEYYSGINSPHIMMLQMEANVQKIKQECN